MNPPPLLLFFIDAFAFDYLAARPFLPGFWQEERPLETLLGYSSSIVPALWSGLYPDEMNAWNEFYYHPRQPYRLPRLLDRAPHPYVRNFLRRALFRVGARFGCYRQSLPGIPGSVEHLFSRARVDCGCFSPIPLGEAGLETRLARAGFRHHFWSADHVFNAEQALADLKQSLPDHDVFIYATAALDGAGHQYGPAPMLFDQTLRQLEEFIRPASQLLASKGDAQVMVVSDHGMTEVVKRFDLLAWLRPWSLGREYVAFLDSTMARFWDKGKLPLGQVMERVAASGLGRFLEQADRDRYGLNFPDNRFGDAVFLLNPGVLLSPSFMEMPYVPFAPGAVKGMHGYAPSCPSTRGIFLYWGRPRLSRVPTKVTEVAGLVMDLLTKPAQSPA